jgi:hypothetical protein
MTPDLWDTLYMYVCMYLYKYIYIQTIKSQCRVNIEEASVLLLIKLHSLE